MILKISHYEPIFLHITLNNLPDIFIIYRFTKKICLLFHSFFQRNIPYSAIFLFRYVYFKSVEVKFQMLIAQKKHMDLYFLDYFCFFWTLRIINSHIKEKSLYFENRPAITFNKQGVPFTFSLFFPHLDYQVIICIFKCLRLTIM